MEKRVGTRVDQSGDLEPLQWLSGILWPAGEARIATSPPNSSVTAKGADGAGLGLSWWASPSSSAAEILIPTSSQAAARTAVRRYHDGFTTSRRLRSLAAELVMRWPAAANRLLAKRTVSVTGQGDSGVPARLRAALDTELHMAVTLGRPKSNRKPVLQLIDDHGICIGWAKIGWNEWTAGLVGNEADWLQRPASAPLVVPRVLHDQTDNGQRVVVTTGFTAGRLPSRNPAALPSPELLLAIAAMGQRGRQPVGETAWWASVEAVLASATATEARAIAAVAETMLGQTIEVGAWHGDLTPWNIMTKRGRPRTFGQRNTSYQVIDWEFAADEVPLGFDLCHFHTQVAVEMKAMSAEQALDHSARLSPQGLAELGVDPNDQLNVYRLYLVELIRRTLALRAAGVAVDEVRQGVAAVKRLGAGTGFEPPVSQRIPVQPRSTSSEVSA